MAQNTRYHQRRLALTIGVVNAVVLCLAAGPATQASGAALQREARPAPALPSESQWRELDGCIDRGLAWLASQQAADGAFLTDPNGEPGVTALCMLAFMSRGHTSDEGAYRLNIRRAIDFMLSCRRPDGLLCLINPSVKMEP